MFLFKQRYIIWENNGNSMDLKSYLNSIGQSGKFFAKRLGVTPQCIYNYYTKKRNPSKFVKEKIEELTDGKVRADEWKN